MSMLGSAHAITNMKLADDILDLTFSFMPTANTFSMKLDLVENAGKLVKVILHLKLCIN